MEESEGRALRYDIVRRSFGALRMLVDGGPARRYTLTWAICAGA
jgi:hypothetical protein